jgi:DNA-binding MarR family transcriptional regulator
MTKGQTNALPGTPESKKHAQRALEHLKEIAANPDRMALPVSFPSRPRKEGRAGAVSHYLRMRRYREKLFGEIFADPAWDMLLELYLAELEKRQLSVTAVSVAGAVPPSTGIRWITTMTEAGMIERVADPYDRRRTYLHLSKATYDLLDEWTSRAMVVE